MGDIKVRDNITGEVHTIRYTGDTPPSAEEIASLFDTAKGGTKTPALPPGSQGYLKGADGIQRKPLNVPYFSGGVDLANTPAPVPYRRGGRLDPPDPSVRYTQKSEANFKELGGMDTGLAAQMGAVALSIAAPPAAPFLLPFAAPGLVAGTRAAGAASGALAAGARGGSRVAANRAVQTLVPVGAALGAGAAVGGADAKLRQAVTPGTEQTRARLTEELPVPAQLVLENVPGLAVNRIAGGARVAERLFGAATGAASEGANQIGTGKFDPLRVGGSALLGATMVGPDTTYGKAQFDSGFTSGYAGAKVAGAKRLPSKNAIAGGKEEAKLFRQGEKLSAKVKTSGLVPKPGSKRNQDPSVAPKAPVKVAAATMSKWRVTDYGQENDPTPDSNSARGIGAFSHSSRAGSLKDGYSFAVSRDVESSMRGAGVRPGEEVTFTLSDGRKVKGRWDDRTAESYKGKKLTGRVDFYSPSGNSPIRDAAITAFQRGGDGRVFGTSAASADSKPVTSWLDALEEVKTSARIRQQAVEEAETAAKPAESPDTEPEPYLPVRTEAQDPEESPYSMVNEEGNNPDIPESLQSSAGTTTRRVVSSRPAGKIRRVSKGGKPSYTVENKSGTPEPADGVSYTFDNKPVPFRYEVVSANDLALSHLDDLTENPDYPKWLQPRDRTRSISTYAQVADKANNLIPGILFENAITNYGAPIIGPDNFTEAGNGRGLILRKVYTDPQFAKQRAAYEAAVNEFANRRGLNTNGVENPVVIRRRVGDLSPEERAALAQSMNSEGMLQSTRAENAQRDSQAVTESIAAYKIGLGLGHRDNQNFVTNFVKGLPKNELPNIIDEGTRSLSDLGEARIRSAMLATAYDDPAIIKAVVNSGGEGIGRNIARAMVETAPEMARVKHGVKTGEYGDYDITGNVAEAVRKLASKKNRQEVRAEINAMRTAEKMGGNLLGEDAQTDPVTIKLMDVLSTEKDGKPVYKNSREKSENFLINYSELVSKIPVKSLDGSAPPSKEQLIDVADKLARGEKVEMPTGQKSMDMGEAAPTPAAKPAPKPSVQFGKEGFRGSNEGTQYGEKTSTGGQRRGWKLHLTVKPDNYAAVDKWLYENHKGLYKLLSGGDAGEKDFTIYTGSYKDSLALSEKINAALSSILEPNKALAAGDRVISGKVSGRFEIPKGESDPAFDGMDKYGRNGVPFTTDQVFDSKNDPSRSNANYSQNDAALRKKYGEYYSGEGRDNPPAPPKPATQSARPASQEPKPAPPAAQAGKSPSGPPKPSESPKSAPAEKPKAGGGKYEGATTEELKALQEKTRQAVADTQGIMGTKGARKELQAIQQELQKREYDSETVPKRGDMIYLKRGGRVIAARLQSDPFKSAGTGKMIAHANVYSNGRGLGIEYTDVEGAGYLGLKRTSDAPATPATPIESLNEIPKSKIIQGKTLGQHALERLQSIAGNDPELKARLEENGSFDTITDYNFRNSAQAERSLNARASKDAAKPENADTLFEKGKTAEQIKQEKSAAYKVTRTAEEQIRELVDDYVSNAKEYIASRKNFISKFGQDAYDSLPPHYTRKASTIEEAFALKRDYDNAPTPKVEYLVNASKGDLSIPVHFAKNPAPKEAAVIARLETDGYLTRTSGMVNEQTGKFETVPLGTYGSSWLYMIKKPIPASYAESQRFDAFGKDLQSNAGKEADASEAVRGATSIEGAEKDAAAFALEAARKRARELMGGGAGSSGDKISELKEKMKKIAEGEC